MTESAVPICADVIISPSLKGRKKKTHSLKQTRFAPALGLDINFLQYYFFYYYYNGNMNLCYEIKKLDFCFFGCDGLTAPFKNVRTGFLLCRNHFFFFLPLTELNFPPQDGSYLRTLFAFINLKKSPPPQLFWGKKPRK